jgi:hypothetical protein
MTQAKRLIRLQVCVRNEVKWRLLVIQIERQQFGLCHGDDQNPGPRLLDFRVAILHLDEVRLARDSSQVANENEQQRGTGEVGKPAFGPVGSSERNVYDAVAKVHGLTLVFRARVRDE